MSDLIKLFSWRFIQHIHVEILIGSERRYIGVRLHPFFWKFGITRHGERGLRVTQMWYGIYDFFFATTYIGPITLDVNI